MFENHQWDIPMYSLSQEYFKANKVEISQVVPENITKVYIQMTEVQ